MEAVLAATGKQHLEETHRFRVVQYSTMPGSDVGIIRGDLCRPLYFGTLAGNRASGRCTGAGRVFGEPGLRRLCRFQQE